MIEDFDTLFEEYGKMIYNRSYKMCGASEAEELTQEIFFKIFQHQQSFKEKSKISTWIYRIGINTCLQHLRKQKLRKLISYEEIFENSRNIKEAESKHPDPEEQYNLNELQKIYLHSLDMLLPEQKAAYYLYNHENLSYKEISEALSCSISAVESKIFRARKNLQKIIGKHYPEHLNNS